MTPSPKIHPQTSWHVLIKSTMIIRSPLNMEGKKLSFACFCIIKKKIPFVPHRLLRGWHNIKPLYATIIFSSPNTVQYIDLSTSSKIAMSLSTSCDLLLKEHNHVLDSQGIHSIHVWSQLWILMPYSAPASITAEPAASQKEKEKKDWRSIW